jgi:cell division protein FtsN
MKQQNPSLTFARFSAQITRQRARTTFVILALAGWSTLATNAFARSPKSPSAEFAPREVEFQAQPQVQAPPAKQEVIPNSKPESYLVYINEVNLLRLQQVQQLEPTAYVRQYQGRSVIQAGVFSQNFNAQNLANKLEAQGIDARIVSLTTGKDTDFVGNNKFYFVVILAKREKLAAVENQVKQLKMGMPINVSQKAQPRSHIRVGPFLNRKQAENWKRYLKASGVRKARVYYGQ